MEDLVYKKETLVCEIITSVKVALQVHPFGVFRKGNENRKKNRLVQKSSVQTSHLCLKRQLMPSQ